MANRSSNKGPVGGEAGLFAAIEGLARLADVFDRRRRQLAGVVGLTDTQWRLLEEIAREDFMPSLFARRRACTPAAISRTLKQLQEKSLIRAAISQGDGRQRDYSLTPAGKRIVARMRAGRQRALDAVWGELDQREIEAFGRFSADLAERLEAYADEHG
jgi:DNA-binding MarR family transcriptional regulator